MLLALLALALRPLGVPFPKDALRDLSIPRLPPLVLAGRGGRDRHVERRRRERG